MDNDNLTEEPAGYTPRRYNVYELQLQADLADGNVASVNDLIDGWVRTVAIETDLTETQVDAIVEKIWAAVADFREREHSPFAVVEEIREMMMEERLSP